MQNQTSTSPLEGVRVLDFSIMLAGPYCARLLADVGAEVIKIEPPEGDEMRLRAPVRDGHSAYFGQLNAGKRSIALDLKSSDAIKLVHRMVENTDILVENFRPGVMERLGLGYDTLRKINPRLIYASVTGYGECGEDAEKPDALLEPDAIALTYLNILRQPRSAWTWEVELRPWVERF